MCIKKSISVIKNIEYILTGWYNKKIEHETSNRKGKI